MTPVRVRLTLAYAGLLAAACALLLGVSYLLVRAHLRAALDPTVAGDAVGALSSQYLLALAAVVLLALGGGWLISGEVLGPLERAMLAQRRFVANASHELRTPMTAIRVDAEVALDDPSPTVDGLRAVLARTVLATEQTDELTEALLALASASEGPRAHEPVDLRAVVAAALPPDCRVDARLEPTTVRGDGTLLARAAANLVDNALRHGRPGGQVVVTLADGTLEVRNLGRPIPADDLARLTQPFERLQRTAASGSGLGLSIVQAIADAHGGRLELEAPPEGGLVARLRLPAQPAKVENVQWLPSGSATVSSRAG